MINATNGVNSLLVTNVLKETSKSQKTSEANFKDSVSNVERIKAVIDKIEKAIPGIYVNAVDYKKINGFQSYAYPVDKVFQKDLTLEDFNNFKRLKNTASDSPEQKAYFNNSRWKKAVLIHPDTLDKMSKDPAYFDKIIYQVKELTDRVGTCANPAYPNAMTSSMVVGVDENGNVERQWSNCISAGIVESKHGIKNGKSRRDIEKEHLEKYLERLWLDRKLTQESILETQMQRKESLARLQKENLLKNNPYDLD